MHDVDSPSAIGIEDLGGDTLREHVFRGRQSRRRGVAVNVDETGGDEKSRDVEVQHTLAPGEIANFGDISIPYAQVGLIGLEAGAVENRPVTHDRVVRDLLCGLSRYREGNQ